MNAKRCAAVLLMLQALSCGGDDSGAKASGSSAAGSGGAAADEPGTVACGATKCHVPKGYTGEACCKDTFSATCGIKVTADMCSPVPEQKEPNCPDGTLANGPMALFVRGCCVEGTDECGVNVIFGPQIAGVNFTGTCETLERAKQFASSTGMETVETSLPAPTHCDGTPIE